MASTLNNVPLAGQSLANSRGQINSNFNVISTTFEVDHVNYNLTNQGMHKRVSFPIQSVAPTPLAGIVQLYSQTSSITGQPELVFTHQSGSTAPLAAQIVEFTSAGWANPGWARLPSGILLKWHAGISMTGVATVAINLNTDIPGSPNFTTVYSVFNSTTSASSYTSIVDIKSLVGTTVTFGINGGSNPPAGFTVAYLAIGI